LNSFVIITCFGLTPACYFLLLGNSVAETCIRAVEHVLSTPVPGFAPEN